MATKVGACIICLQLCLLLCTKTTSGRVQLSNSNNLAEHSAACVGEQVTFECTGINIVLMRWVMEPFVSSFNPVTFIPTQKEGTCFNASNSLIFCLTSLSPSPDGAIADMTSTLTFVASETIDGITLNGTKIKCNEENVTLQVNKDSPSVRDLNCNISRSDTFCDNSTSRVKCTWAPLLDDGISYYIFNITSKVYGKLYPRTVAVSESMLEFFLMCSDSAEIVAFVLNNCASRAISQQITGNCSKCNNVQNHGDKTETAVLVTGLAVSLFVTLCCIYIIMVVCLLAPGVLRSCLQKMQVTKSSNVKITWRKCKELPLKMSHIHVVKIDSKLYCGGGFTGSSSTANKVLTCTFTGTELGEWKILPGRCPVVRFALTHYTVNGKMKLVTVGGVEVRRIHNEANSEHYTESILTDEVYTCSTEGEHDGSEWEMGLSKLNEPRLYPAALNYGVNGKEYIIACGGIPNVSDVDIYHADLKRTNIVEIYDGQKWEIVNHLPMKRNCLSLASVDQKIYALGGGEAQEAFNDAAIMTFIDKNCMRKWEKIKSCPLAGSTAIGIKGRLLVIGGKNIVRWPQSLIWKSEAKKSVYIFSKGKWEEVQVNGNAPSIYMAAVKELSENEFIMIGGQHTRDTPEPSVYIGTLSCN